MKSLNCLIIDDEHLARQGLKDYCDDISFINVVGLCKNAMQANDLIHLHKIDLLFLDINMPLVSGLDWLKTVERSPLVVMTTAYEEYALESYAYEVVDYLVKPISFHRFLQAANKVYRLSNVENQRDALFIKDNQSLKKVAFDEILYIESMQNYVKIITEKETMITHSTLKQLRETLPATCFIQTHKSYMVSKQKIDEIVGNLIIIGHHKVPISIRSKKEVLEKITR